MFLDKRFRCMTLEAQCRSDPVNLREVPCKRNKSVVSGRAIQQSSSLNQLSWRKHLTRDDSCGCVIFFSTKRLTSSSLLTLTNCVYLPCRLLLLLPLAANCVTSSASSFWCRASMRSSTRRSTSEFSSSAGAAVVTATKATRQRVRSNSFILRLDCWRYMARARPP